MMDKDLKSSYCHKLIFVEFKEPDYQGRISYITVEKEDDDEPDSLNEICKIQRLATIQDLIQEEKEFGSIFLGLMEIQEGIYQYHYQYENDYFIGKYVRIK